MTVPCEIRESRRAVVWRYETRRDGKPTKVPYSPQRPHRRAAVNDPTSWGKFTTALAVVADGQADGPGIVLGNGLVGVDLDHVREPGGTLTEDATRIVQQLD